MKVAIHQPNFLPWLGYFNKIKEVDIFVILDNVQYVKGTVANRNEIKNKKNEKQYITTPVKLSKGYNQNYNQIEIDYSTKWVAKHLNLFKDSYYKAPFFDEIFTFIEAIYLKKHLVLSELNIDIILLLINKLEISTEIQITSNINKHFGAKNDQNIAICNYFKADIYLSGTGAKKYNIEELYNSHEIIIEYQNFTHPTYPQLHGEFISHLSIIDALFNVGFEGVKKLI